MTLFHSRALHTVPIVEIWLYLLFGIIVVVGEVKGIMITEGLHISLWSAQLVGQAIYWSIF